MLFLLFLKIYRVTASCIFCKLQFNLHFFFSTGKEVKKVAYGVVRVTSNDMLPTEGAACNGRSQIGVKEMERAC